MSPMNIIVPAGTEADFGGAEHFSSNVVSVSFYSIVTLTIWIGFNGAA